MEKKKIQLRKQEVVTDISCDCCGASCKVGEGTDYDGNQVYSFEYMELSASWGYYSGKDMESWKAHLCEKCVDERLGFISFDKGRIRLR